MDEATTVATAMKSVQQHARARTSNRIDALFVQHLLSDSVVEPTAANERQRFEAIARSVRDMLSQRWLNTEQTYQREPEARLLPLDGVPHRPIARQQHYQPAARSPDPRGA